MLLSLVLASITAVTNTQSYALKKDPIGEGSFFSVKITISPLQNVVNFAIICLFDIWRKRL